MRLLLVCVPVAIAAAFFLGRATSSDSGSHRAKRHISTGRQGDSILVWRNGNPDKPAF